MTDTQQFQIDNPTSIAELEGWHPAEGTVVTLDAGGRSGKFRGTTTDISTEVTADPQQGIYIAAFDDATGASGGWVRQYEGPIYASWFGGVADWNGTTGTDNSPFLQAAIDFFGTDRGVVKLMDGQATHATGVNFKRVALEGVGSGSAYDSGVSYLHFQGTAGLSSSIEDNRAPLHKDFYAASTTTRTANGQILLDLTGLNYPRLSNVLIYGGEEGLRISDGSTVESHYGAFVGVDISRSYRGVRVMGGAQSQTHAFFGGRIWDCVEAYENAEGTSDICFYGTAFESDIAIVHTDAGADPSAASTKLFSCRDESDVPPDIAVGAIHEFGTYWSGNRMPTYLEYDATDGATEMGNQIMIDGVKNRISHVGRNILRNPSFTPDVNDTSIIPGWADTSGVPIESSNKGAFGHVIQMTGFDATSRTLVLRQNNINVREGYYTWGITYSSLGTTGTFTTKLTEDGTALTDGVDFTGTAVDTGGGNRRVHYIKFLRDIDNLRFECNVAAINNADDCFFTEPFLVEGQHSKDAAPVHEGVGVFYADSIPTTGGFQIGDTVWMTAPVEAGSASSKYIIQGWRRLTAGTGHVLNTDWFEMRMLTGN